MGVWAGLSLCLWAGEVWRKCRSRERRLVELRDRDVGLHRARHGLRGHAIAGMSFRGLIRVLLSMGGAGKHLVNHSKCKSLRRFLTDKWSGFKSIVARVQTRKCVTQDDDAF